ncbi:MAG: DUF3794 domain-containing protein [Clostridia bacterium]|nr:DUF3794 domain-containing protein [Clostridia bacterium]
MNIETINETINSTKLISNDKKIKVVEGDMSVPDIKPDILSLVDVDNEVYITKEEVENGKVNIEGMMDVSIIYMSEEENGTFRNLNNVFNFYETFNVDGVTEDSIVDLKVFKGATECKVINGRKINIKSPITLNLKTMNNAECSVAKDIVDDRNVELKKDKVSMNMLCNCKCQDINLKENISLDEDCPPIGEILRANMKIVNEDFKISYNKILAKADAMIKIIYVADNENQTPQCFESTVPVMGFIEFEGIQENMDVKLNFNIESFMVHPIYQDLKSVSFAVESDIMVKACVYQKEEFEMISDIYRPDMDLHCTFEDIQVLQNVIHQNENIEMMQGLLIPDLQNIRILNIDATPNIITKNILDGKVALEGNIAFDVLFCNEVKRTLENKKMELPFQQVVKVEGLQSGMDADVNMNIVGIDYQKIDDSQIQIKISANVNVCVEKEETIRGIKGIEAEELSHVNMPSIVIYYVKPGDTLWNIAKKFRTTSGDIMEQNGLDSDHILPGQQLIIPRRMVRAKVELMS